MKKAKLVILSLLSLLLLFLIPIIISGCSALGTNPNKEEMKKFEKSQNFDNKNNVFMNRDRNIMDKLKKRPKFKGGIFNFLFGNDNQRRPEKGLPVIKPDLKNFLAPSDSIKIVWFGHSTFMLNIEGKIILVDPIVSEYASPVFFIMRRFQSSPLSLEELPKIDYILITHDHYDHLDMPTIKHFRKKDTKFLVPLGVGSHLKGWGIEEKRISELDWWESHSHDSFEFIATPAQHFSGRSLNNRNSTLWASWVIKTKAKNIFISGDTGYDTHFKEIGDKFGPFDLAFIENGQYNVEWKKVHLHPEEGVKAFYDLQAKVFFPVHWGAFTLSIHSWFEPIQRAYNLSMENNYPLIAPRIGELVTVDENYRVNPWWEQLILN